MPPGRRSTDQPPRPSGTPRPRWATSPWFRSSGASRLGLPTTQTRSTPRRDTGSCSTRPSERGCLCQRTLAYGCLRLCMPAWAALVVQEAQEKRARCGWPSWTSAALRRLPLSYSFHFCMRSSFCWMLLSLSLFPFPRFVTFLLCKSPN